MNGSPFTDPITERRIPMRERLAWGIADTPEGVVLTLIIDDQYVVIPTDSLEALLTTLRTAIDDRARLANR